MGRLEKLMRDLLKKLFEDEGKEPPQYISEMDRDSLLDAVRKYLQHKRSVVIFDDVWSVKLWTQIENALLDNNNGSRILITTRSREVVTSCEFLDCIVPDGGTEHPSIHHVPLVTIHTLGGKTRIIHHWKSSH
ncbi:hypothetical protein D0Y65_022199 [Glycine soja]|uniref:NB-ARC domain-containing protein n=1 Tax=Glycine soja TaxID=3848 RepID=A0A445JMH8_GLYSO|nr:hypothetical protein D0Y65_022199 [Glycine soja]